MIPHHRLKLEKIHQKTTLTKVWRLKGCKAVNRITLLGKARGFKFFSCPLNLLYQVFLNPLPLKTVTGIQEYSED
jgi:hypothetical protein